MLFVPKLSLILSEILIDVNFKSSKLLSKSGTDKFKALFILAASKVQLLIPIKLIPVSFSFSFSSFPSISKLQCNAFKGLCLDLSANPNSSNKIIKIGNSLLLPLNPFNLPSAFLNKSSTSFGVVESEP